MQQIYGTETDVCPEKSIPITRITLEELVQFEILQDCFNKTLPHIQNGLNDAISMLMQVVIRLNKLASESRLYAK